MAATPWVDPETGPVRGRYTVTVVPVPGALSSITWPPVWRTKPYTMLRPSPVPRPSSLVV